MNGLRKLICLLLAIFAVGFLQSANAAAPLKKFSINITQNFLPPATKLVLNLIIKNETPNGNSSINSLLVKLPSGYTYDATNASALSSNGWTGQFSPAPADLATTVTFVNMSPLKPLQSFTMSIPINTPSTANCTPSTWTADAYTGSSLSGNLFTQVYVVPDTQFPVNSTTEVAGNLTSSFTTQPGNAEVGKTIPSAVVTLKACSPATAAVGVPVTVSVPSCTGTCSLSGTTTRTTDSSGNATFDDLSINQVGTYTMKAQAGSFPDATSNPFTIFGGTLNCQPTMPYSFGDDPNGDITQEGYASGTRGFWNKDGVSCVPLLYTFTNSILTPDPFSNTTNTVHLQWDTSSGQHPAFTYVMTWKTEDVDNSTDTDTTTSAIKYGWPVPRRVWAAWTLDVNGDPAFVPAQACVSPDLPAPYAQLAAGIGTALAGASQQISVTIPPSIPMGFPPPPTVPTTAPFPIVIGTERMLVTAVSGSTWTVTRGDGGTAPAGAPAHSANDYVMSTPLPLDSTGVQVPVCVQSHAWQSVGFDPATGLAQIRYTTRVFDIGDAWILNR